MLTEKFDPFGEALPDDVRARTAVSQTQSALLSRIGQLVFWGFALVIVYARIRYFSGGL